MTIIKRADLGRPLTWDELDDNFEQVDSLTAAASAAVSSAAASATAAAGSATNAATSATDAANSAANSAAAVVSAVKSTVTFTTGGTLESNLDRISDGTYLYYWTGTYPVTVPADSTVSGTGGIGTGFWAVDTDLLLRNELTNADGTVSQAITEQAVARVFDLPNSQVKYLTVGLEIDARYIVFDELTSTSWYRGEATGAVVSWSISDSVLTLVTSTGTFSLSKANSWDGLKTDLASTSGASLVGLSPAGTVQNALVNLTPPSVGIVEGDSTTDNHKLWNSLFAICPHILLPAGNWYCNGGSINIADASFSIRGEGKHVSNLIFTTAGYGIHQTISNIDNGVPKFYLSGVSIKTTVAAASNTGAGFSYDSSGYLATLTVGSSGYKYLGERVQSRGGMFNCSVGTFTSESSQGWPSAVEILGALGTFFDTVTFELPRDLSGDGIWYHGDGQQSGCWITNCASLFGNRFFRMNDYLEGLYISGCNIINCKYGIWSEPDSDTTVTSNVLLNTPAICNNHILSYIKAIRIDRAVGGKITDLEQYLYYSAGISTNVAGIDVTTADSLKISNISSVAISDIPGTGYIVQLHAGRNNTITNVSHRGGNMTYGILLATTTTLRATTVKNLTLNSVTNGLYANLTNLDGLDFDVPLLNSTGTVTTPIQISAEAYAAIRYNFKRHLFAVSHAYTSASADITVDISAAGFKGTPLFVWVNPNGGAYGGQMYSYVRSSSSSTSIVIRVTYVNGQVTDTTTTRNAYIEIVGY